jgi:hypothetical protein
MQSTVSGTGLKSSRWVSVVSSSHCSPRLRFPPSFPFPPPFPKGTAGLQRHSSLCISLYFSERFEATRRRKETLPHRRGERTRAGATNHDVLAPPGHEAARPLQARDGQRFHFCTFPITIRPFPKFSSSPIHMTDSSPFVAASRS